VRAFANKLPEHSARLAAILTLVGDLKATEVSESTMQAGIKSKLLTRQRSEIARLRLRLSRKCGAAKPAKVAKLHIFAPSRGLATLAPLATSSLSVESTVSNFPHTSSEVLSSARQIDAPFLETARLFSDPLSDDGRSSDDAKSL
jgi:hypothetical protein